MDFRSDNAADIAPALFAAMAPATLAACLAVRGPSVTQHRPGALSLMQATERGTVSGARYAPGRCRNEVHVTGTQVG
jgi:hypothetical protein